MHDLFSFLAHIDFKLVKKFRTRYFQEKYLGKLLAISKLNLYATDGLINANLESLMSLWNC